MPIRVISGSAKGRKLKMVPGDSTRPVMDRVKEAVFNILGSGIQDASLLDLFAGTGSVGIEALSRGAARVVFIDNTRQAITTIQENLQITQLSDRAEVVRSDAFSYLERGTQESFDYIYIAPPQYKGIWKDTIRYFDRTSDKLNPDAILIVQIDPVEVEEVELSTLYCFDQRSYGNTTVMFYEKYLSEDDA